MVTISRATALIDLQEIQRTYQLLVPPGQVVEIRALDASAQAGSRYTATYSGYFDNLKDLLGALRTIRTATGIYLTLQPCHPDLLHRAKNKLVEQKRRNATTSDDQITRYAWLPIDCDPERIAGISSTDEQHEQALALCRTIQETMQAESWPAPIKADSGNGGHLLYKIDLAVTNSDLMKRVLEGFATRFDAPGVHIDQTLFNPSRIIKLYGTRACKGDNTQERPHRMSRLLEVPEDIQIVTQAQLEAIAVPAQASTIGAGNGQKSYEGHREDFTAEKFLQQHQIEVTSIDTYQGGTRYHLAACPWNPSHTDASACIYQFADGRLGASCSHNSCKGKGWRDLRLAFEPDAYTPRNQISKQQTSQKEKAQANTEEDVPVKSLSDVAQRLCSFSADDAGNGDAMFYLFGQDFLYCSTLGWLFYNGTHWELDADGAEVKKRAVETLRRRRHAAVDAEKEEIIKCTKADDKRVNGCVNRFRTLVPVKLDAFDNDPDLLNCRNGALNLQCGTLEPHSCTQRFTYCLPVEYGEADCSAWINYLAGTVGGGQEVIDYLQMAAGYSLTGHTREEILFYLHGPTRSGKGTFAEVFMALLPSPLSTMVDFNSFTAKREGDVSNFDLAPLKPSRMIFASESLRGQFLNPAKIKQLTGGDHVRASFKHRDFFTYRPQFQVWMLSNWPVNGDPEDDALWGRVRVIEFPNSYLGKEDKNKKAALKTPEVLKGILYWAVQGAMKWYTLGAAGLSTPQAVIETTSEQRAELDYVQQWIDEACVVNQDAWTSNEEVIRSYTEWCKNNNIQFIKGAKKLAQSLQGKGYATGVQRWISAEGKNKKGVQGLKIISANLFPMWSPSSLEENPNGSNVSGKACNDGLDEPVERLDAHKRGISNGSNARIQESLTRNLQKVKSQIHALDPLEMPVNESKNTVHQPIERIDGSSREALETIGEALEIQQPDKLQKNIDALLDRLAQHFAMQAQEFQTQQQGKTWRKSGEATYQPHWRLRYNGYAPGNIPPEEHLCRLRALLSSEDAEVRQEALAEIHRRLGDDRR